jgi:hypothetical protein
VDGAGDAAYRKGQNLSETMVAQNLGRVDSRSDSGRMRGCGASVGGGRTVDFAHAASSGHTQSKRPCRSIDRLATGERTSAQNNQERK